MPFVVAAEGPKEYTGREHLAESPLDCGAARSAPEGVAMAVHAESETAQHPDGHGPKGVRLLGRRRWCSTQSRVFAARVDLYAAGSFHRRPPVRGVHVGAACTLCGPRSRGQGREIHRARSGLSPRVGPELSELVNQVLTVDNWYGHPSRRSKRTEDTTERRRQRSNCDTSWS